MESITIPSALSLALDTSKIDYPSLSIDSDYIPINSLSDGECIINKATGSKLFLYSLHLPSSNYFFSVRKFTIFCANISNIRNIDTWFELFIRDITKRYVGNYGMIVNIEDNPMKLVPLMLIAVKQRYIFNISREETDLSKFALIINRRFIDDESHFQVYRNIKRLYIDPVFEGKLDIVYTNDIIRLCYGNQSLSLPKFKTINEMVNHTKSINSLISQTLQTETNGNNTNTGERPPF